MTVTINSKSSGGNGANGVFHGLAGIGSGGSTISSFQNIAAGATFLLVGITVGDSSSAVGTISFTWAGSQSMTSLGAVVQTANTFACQQLFGLVNPTTGSQSLKFTWSGSGSGDSVSVFGIAFNGSVSSSVAAATEGYHTATGSSSAPSVATASSIPSTDIAVGFLINDLQGTTFSSVNLTEIDITSTDGVAGANETTGAGSTVTASGVLSGSADWAAMVVGIKAASAGGSGPLPSGILLPPSPRMVGWRGLRSLAAYPPAPPVTSDTPNPSPYIVFPPQWLRNGALLAGMATDVAEFAVANPHWQGRLQPSGWWPNQGLMRSTAQDFSISAAETNPHWQGKFLATIWVPKAKLWQTDPQDFSASAQDTPPPFVPRTWPPQWQLYIPLGRDTAQDFSISAAETNTFFQPKTYPSKWLPTNALRQNAALDVPAITSDTPPPTNFKTWAVQWLPLAMRSTAQDFSISAAETNVHTIFKTFAAQWAPTAGLLRNSDTVSISVQPETNTFFIPRTWPVRWTMLLKTENTAQDFSASAAETNVLTKFKTFPPQWARNAALIRDVDTVSPVVQPETNTFFLPRTWAPQWKLLSLERAPPQDTSASAAATNTFFIPHPWPVFWALNSSLLKGTAQDFSFVPPPIVTFPATYYLLEDHWIGDVLLPAGTIQQTADIGGLLPAGWTPGPNVDPVDANAVAAYTAAGPRDRGLSRQQYYNIPVYPANYVWRMIQGQWRLIQVANWNRSQPPGQE